MNTNLQKYLKYKSKYLDLKNELQLQVGGSNSFLYGGAIADDPTKINNIYQMLENGITDTTTGTVGPVDKLVHYEQLLDIDDPDNPPSKLYQEDDLLDLFKKSVYAYHGLKVAIGDLSKIDDVIANIQNDRNVAKPALEQLVRDLQAQLQKHIASTTAMSKELLDAQTEVAASNTQIAALQGQLAAAGGTGTAALAAAQGQIAALQGQLAAANSQITSLQAQLAPVHHVLPGPPGGSGAAATGDADSIIATTTSLNVLNNSQFNVLFPTESINSSAKIIKNVGAIMAKLKPNITTSLATECDNFKERLIGYINSKINTGNNINTTKMITTRVNDVVKQHFP